MAPRNDHLVQKHNLRADLIYKTRVDRRPVDNDDPVPTMDAATQARWDKWCDSMIRNKLDPALDNVEEMLVYVIVRLRREFRAELDLIIRECESEETAARLLPLREQLRERLQQEAENE
jgi:hypothetical protein